MRAALSLALLLACASGPPPAQLSDSEILGVLRDQTADITTCQQKQREADPSVTGQIEVKLVITQEGRTERIRVEPERFVGTVGAKCLEDVVAKWIFPQFTGAKQPIDFPVVFR